MEAPDGYLTPRGADDRLAEGIDEHGYNYCGNTAGVLRSETVPIGFPRDTEFSHHSSWRRGGTRSRGGIGAPGRGDLRGSD